MPLLNFTFRALAALSKPQKERSPGVRLRIAAFSDTHITAARYRRVLLIPGMKRLKRFAPDLALFAGDCTDNGNEANWKAVAKLIAKYCPIQNRLVAIGNHDTWMSYSDGHEYAPARDLYLKYASRIMGEPLDSVCFAREYAGLPFFVLGTEGTSVAADIGEEQLRWLSDALDAADARRADGEPVFVVNHHPMNFTHGVGDNIEGMGINGTASKALLRILDRHKNVVYICGHIHFGLKKGATVEKVSKNVTSVCLPCYEYGEMFMGKHATGGDPLIGTGALLDVEANRLVIRGCNFMLGKRIKTYEESVSFT